MPQKWRIGVFIALFVLFPVVLHPWWLFLLSLVAYGVLVWLVRGWEDEGP
jgi:hypothetical protein